MHFLDQHFVNANQIIVDNGSAFRSNEFKESWEDQKIHPHLINTVCPRGNGQEERINIITKRIFSKIFIEEPKK